MVDVVLVWDCKIRLPPPGINATCSILQLQFYQVGDRVQEESVWCWKSEFCSEKSCAFQLGVLRTSRTGILLPSATIGWLQKLGSGRKVASVTSGNRQLAQSSGSGGVGSEKQPEGDLLELPGTGEAGGWGEVVRHPTGNLGQRHLGTGDRGGKRSATFTAPRSNGHRPEVSKCGTCSQTN